MSTSSISILLTSILLLACSDPESQDWIERVDQVDIPTFEEFRETSRLGDTGEFVVELDIVIASEEQLFEYYTRNYLTPVPKSIIQVDNGIPTVRNGWQGGDPFVGLTDIQYCFDTTNTAWNAGGAQSLTNVRASIAAATAVWEQFGAINFIYLSGLDGAGCTNSGTNPGVDFVVTPNDTRTFSTGAFPHLPWSQQQLSVGTGGLSQSLAIHELGHILGFRHEHIHSGDPASCSEGGSRYELTQFDPNSAMIYQNCSVNLTIAGNTVSALDGVGLRMAYGPKPLRRVLFWGTGPQRLTPSSADEAETVAAPVWTEAGVLFTGPGGVVDTDLMDSASAGDAVYSLVYWNTTFDGETIIAAQNWMPMKILNPGLFAVLF